MFRHLHGAELPRVKKAIKCILTFGLVQMDKKGPSKLLFYSVAGFVPFLFLSFLYYLYMCGTVP